MIENYDVIVNDTRKVRGAVMYTTDNGPLLLKEIKFSEKRLPVLYDLSKELEKHGYPRTDAIMKTKEGEFYCVSENDTKYILQKETCFQIQYIIQRLLLEQSTLLC